MDEIQEKLLKILSDDTSFDHINDWIFANVPESQQKQPKFIRALTTAICDATINGKKLNEPAFKKYENLIRKYADSITELELECLCAIQACITKLEHPPGILLKIFNSLWEAGIICNETFINWKDNDIIEEGKGVAVKSLTSFFLVVNESELSDEAS